MGTLSEIPLSIHTLTFVTLLPFAYFALAARYPLHSRLRKRLEIALQLVSALLALGLLFLFLRRPSASPQDIHIALLHIAPPALTLLIIAQMRNLRPGRAIPTREREPARFTPLNHAVERVGWDDLVLDEDLKEEFQSIISLLQQPEKAQRYGIDLPKGILLSGPPGTGKTSIAKAIANTAGLSFFALRADEIISKWVGESEKNLSMLFTAAQKHAPSVIFIDEIDSIGKNRTGTGQQWAENLLNHLLQLVDGVVRTEGIYIIGATNRVDLVDSALKRPGRLTKVIEIPLPDFESRRKLFEKALTRLQLEDGVDLDMLAQVTAGRSPADIKEICNQAGLNAFRRESTGKRRSYAVNGRDLQDALLEFAGQPACDAPALG